MDKNKDGVVTLEEFVIACQEVCIVQNLYMQYIVVLISSVIYIESRNSGLRRSTYVM